MGDNRFMAAFLGVTEKLVPVLTRLVPRPLLQRIKGRVVQKATKDGISQANPLPFTPAAHPDGVNLIGPVRSAIGLGQSSRLVAATLGATGLPMAVYEYHPIAMPSQNDDTLLDQITGTTPYNINLVHLNPYDLPLAYLQMGREVFDGRYNIMFWLWELEIFPEEWLPALNLADEVWLPSEFAASGLRKVTEKPIRIIPYPILAPVDPACDRAFFGLPEDAFLFFCTYDGGSTLRRKNPDGVIRAYKEAFPEELPDCGLVIKTSHADKEDIAKLRRELAGYQNVYFINDVLDKAQMNALIACVDAFVSLHRAEGFGLVPAEAMLLGTPVIATGWSSNTEFMDDTVACMVDCTFIEVGDDYGTYGRGNRWADPDTAQAAGYMRKLREDRAFGAALAARAKARIENTLNLDIAAARMKQRIGEIYAEAGRQGQ